MLEWCPGPGNFGQKCENLPQLCHPQKKQNPKLIKKN